LTTHGKGISKSLSWQPMKHRIYDGKIKRVKELKAHEKEITKSLSRHPVKH